MENLWFALVAFAALVALMAFTLWLERAYRRWRFRKLDAERQAYLEFTGQKTSMRNK